MVGCFAACAGMIVLIRLSLLKHDPKHFWACLMFGITGMLVFGISSFYHFLRDGFSISPRLELILEDLDHFAIYLFIAGTYTPFAINALDPPWSTILLTLIWVSGIVGILFTALKPRLPLWMQHRSVYTAIFVAMGCAFVIRFGEIFRHLNAYSLSLLLAGGASYVLGAMVYASKWPKLVVGIFGFHELWHVMVMIGFAFHYFLILGFYY